MVIMLILISFATQAQTSVNYSEVVKVDSVPAKVLFERARAWFVARFKDSKNVLEVNDKESGELTGKGQIAATETSNKIITVFPKTKKDTFQHIKSSELETRPYGTIGFTISIYVKDGRYRIVIANYAHSYTRYADILHRTMDESFGLITDSIQCTPNVAPDCDLQYQSHIWPQLQEQSKFNSKILAESIKQAMASTDKTDW